GGRRPGHAAGECQHPRQGDAGGQTRGDRQRRYREGREEERVARCLGGHLLRDQQPGRQASKTYRSVHGRGGVRTRPRRDGWSRHASHPGRQWSGPRAPEYTGSARAYRCGVGQNPWMAPMQPVQTRCCIAGGGPAGMMLGVLLARAGVDVLVLEKHADFLRDFRGDTVHPSTLELMHELGWLESFLQRPHQELREIGGYVGDERVLVADFSHLPTRCRFVAFMPQWGFLDFLAERARRY